MDFHELKVQFWKRKNHRNLDFDSHLINAIILKKKSNSSPRTH
jgi:hypothetical protein